MFLKLSEEITKAHQKRVVEKLFNTGAVLTYHSLGSGKTLTALKAVERELKENPEGKVLIIAPASLQTNVYNEIEKHGLDIPLDRLKVISYNKAVNQADQLKNEGYSLVILDEAHKIRNPGTKTYSAIKKILNSANRKMFLTATPMYNSHSDLSILLNTLTGKKELPETKKEFESEFVRYKTKDPGFFAKYFLGVNPVEIPYFKPNRKFKELVNKYVDYYNAFEENKKDFPERKDKVIKVEMTDRQRELYNYYLNKLPAPLKWKVKLGLPADKTEAAKLNVFASAIRQISNTTKGFINEDHSPKIDKAVENLIKHSKTIPNFKALVYSNYLKSGLEVYSDKLKEKGIPHALFTGELSKKEKDEIIKKFNEGKIPVLLVSSSGGEGLSLKGTKLVQILEPHFNKSKIEQVIGRAIRYKSHEHLPEAERQVLVEHYLAVSKPSKFDRILGIEPHSIDEYLYKNSGIKSKVSDEITQHINKLQKTAEDYYAHATSKENLKKILDSGYIKAIKHLAKENPNTKINVEPENFNLKESRRKTLPARIAYKIMKENGKGVDYIYLTRNGYLPPDSGYGEYVILKKLKSPEPAKEINMIPEEHVIPRKLSVKNNATIYVPDHEVNYWQRKYPNYDIKPKSEIPVKELPKYSVSSLFKKLIYRAQEKLSTEINPEHLENESKIRKLFSPKATIVGSKALGINVDDSDVDIFIPYKTKSAFEKAKQRLLERYGKILKESPLNKEKEDKFVLTGRVGDKDVDVVLGYGDKALNWFKAFQNAKEKLTPEQAKKIKEEKRSIKNSWFFPEWRYKRYKRQIAEDLGLIDKYF